MTETTAGSLLLLCILGTLILRVVGVIGAGQLNESSAFFRWISCVAFAISAGIMSKILLLPSGVLVDTPIDARIGGIGVGLVVFFFSGRRVLPGVVSGLVAFVLLLLF